MTAPQLLWKHVCLLLHFEFLTGFHSQLRTPPSGNSIPRNRKTTSKHSPASLSFPILPSCKSFVGFGFFNYRRHFKNNMKVQKKSIKLPPGKILFIHETQRNIHRDQWIICPLVNNRWLTLATYQINFFPPKAQCLGLKGGFQKRHVHLITPAMSLSWKKVFAEGITLIIWKWIIQIYQVGPKCIDKCSYKKQKQKYRQKVYVNRGGDQSYTAMAKESLGPSETKISEGVFSTSAFRTLRG
jgi:hypothetical protein